MQKSQRLPASALCDLSWDSPPVGWRSVSAVATGALGLAVADYFLWTAEVDDPVWGSVTGVFDWILALAFVACIGIAIRRALKSRRR